MMRIAVQNLFWNIFEGSCNLQRIPQRIVWLTAWLQYAKFGLRNETPVVMR